MPRETKACSNCGEEFARNPKYSRAQWARAAFCSNTCRGVSLAKERPLCSCGCGQRVQRVGSRYRPGHNVQRTARIWLWHPPGRKPRWVFRDRHGRLVYFARAVMEAQLGRALLPIEVVHHSNGDSTDDRPANLQLFASHAEHMRAEYAAGALPAMH